MNKINQDYIIFNKKYYDVATGKYENPIETSNFIIIQTVDSQYFKSFTVPNHKQCCDIEATTILHGNMEHYINNVKFIAKKGETLIALRDQFHKIESPTITRFLTVAFSVKEDSPYKKILDSVNKQYDKSQAIVFPALTETIKKIVNLFYSFDKHFVTEYLDCLIGELLISIANKDILCDDKNTHDIEEIISSTTNYIDANFINIVTLNEISNYLNFSYTYIAKLFKDLYNISPQQYLNYKKMEMACEELKENELSVSEISEMLKFSSPYNFSRAFKIYTKVSPSEYRKKPFQLKNPLYETKQK